MDEIRLDAGGNLNSPFVRRFEKKNHNYHLNRSEPDDRRPILSVRQPFFHSGEKFVGFSMVPKEAENFFAHWHWRRTMPSGAIAFEHRKLNNHDVTERALPHGAFRGYRAPSALFTALAPNRIATRAMIESQVLNANTRPRYSNRSKIYSQFY